MKASPPEATDVAVAAAAEAAAMHASMPEGGLKQRRVCPPSRTTIPEASVRGMKAKENMWVFEAVVEACQKVRRRWEEGKAAAAWGMEMEMEAS